MKRNSLTKSQLDIWTGQQLSPASPMYNMAFAFEFDHRIDPEIFLETFRLVSIECDALRTTFGQEAGTPFQEIHDEPIYKTNIIDISNDPHQIQNLFEDLKQQTAKVFDTNQCLCVSTLFICSPEKTIWYLNQHHLITDAWSKVILFNRIVERYLELSGEEITGQTLYPFSEYTKDVNSSVDERAQNWWVTRNTDFPQAPAFLGRFNQKNTTQSERIFLPLDQQLSDGIKALAQHKEVRTFTEDLTIYNLFLTVLFVYLYRLTGQSQLSIGSPAHNRTIPDYRRCVGLFIELFPLSITIGQSDTFLDVLEKVKAESFDFLKYAKPGSRNQEVNKKINTILNYIHVDFDRKHLGLKNATWIHSGHADPAHHIRMQVYDFNATGHFEIGLDLNTSIFNDRDRGEIPTQIQQLIQDMVIDIHQPIGASKISSVSPTITGSVLTSDTLVAIHEQISAQAETIPDRTAIVCRDAQVTFEQLENEANQLANYLIRNEIEKGDRVAIWLPRSIPFIVGVLAVLKAGATFVPIPVQTPIGRGLGQIDDAGAKIVLTTQNILPKTEKGMFKTINLEVEQQFIKQESTQNPIRNIDLNELAYLMYTSGSTGKPKGVMIHHDALSHYIENAKNKYQQDEPITMPLFTSVGFDLTITSIFLPLSTGGRLNIYPEPEQGPDLTFFDVLEENQVNTIKLTPSHLSMIQHAHPNSQLKCMIVGGENFKTTVAQQVRSQFPKELRIFNEYGPTEATVGCIVHEYQSTIDDAASIPIGDPMSGVEVEILDQYQHPVHPGASGEIYLGGPGIAKGYWKQPELTAASFIQSSSGRRSYRTGDLARVNDAGIIEYLGRIDEQVKINGRRVELSEIESALSAYEGISEAHVDLRSRRKRKARQTDHNCVRCGLPSNYPTAKFNEDGLCHLCQSFHSYQAKVQRYFKTMPDLKARFDAQPNDPDREYDCIMLLSGGKDSTYALAQLKDFGLNVLAFTLDNGYISEQAKDNIRRVCDELGVDYVFGHTPAMNEIFVDSLERHCNVCDGCFKTIYTLSIQIAAEKQIPFIVTGLSRGQFFETRLTEELFTRDDWDVDQIDKIILDARKSYHQVDDAVKTLIDTSIFEDEKLFEKIQFIDFYRYTDVSLDEMYQYLDTKLPWVRPTDTGRSTNCLINQAGIYVHKKEKGYSNYAFPYSWDVRIGHKTREASLDEINEEIHEDEVHRILEEIGYIKKKIETDNPDQLVAYYIGTHEVNTKEVKRFLSQRIPEYMIPVQYIKLDGLPITNNGKIDKDKLPVPDDVRPLIESEYVAPHTEFEELIQEVWSDVLQINQVGIHDHFLEIGGDSLSGIRVVARLSEILEIDLNVQMIFQYPTIQQLAHQVENMIRTLLEKMDS